MRTIVKMAACALAATLPFTAQAQDAEAVAKNVYAKFARLMERGDVTGMSALLAPDYYAVGLDGKTVEKAQTVAMMKQMCPTFRDVDAKFIVTEAYRSGNEITAWVTMDVKAKVKAEGKWQPMAMKMRFVETMALRDGKWLFVQTHSLDE